MTTVAPVPRSGPWTAIVLVLLLAVMAGLMRAPLREESATVDEGLLLASGYSYWQGYGYRFNPEHPPLSQKIFALPLLGGNATLSPFAQSLLELQTGFDDTRSWDGSVVSVNDLFPDGRDNWYYWPYWETDILGQAFLYGGENDADSLLEAARWTQVGLTMLTGLVIFGWVRRLADDQVALFAVGCWVFNPIVLGYGHLVLTDVGVALLLPLAVWGMAEFLDQPSPGRAAWVGLATGGAVTMKFTGLLLLPIGLGLVLARLFAARRAGAPLKLRPGLVLLAIAVTVLTVLAVYAPAWRPPPPLPVQQAADLGVPWWFSTFRWLLIPPGFFKGIALQTRHVEFGHAAYLCGEWRQHGWWYYYPLAVLLKTPIPLLIMAGLAVIVGIMHRRQLTFPVLVPWLATVILGGFVIAGKVNIGIRYLLPAIPLVIVGMAAVLARLGSRGRLLAGGLGVWLVGVAAWSHPHYLEYFNEFAGGTAHGYRYLVDSNYDWGQDAKRLKRYLDDRPITPLYLAYFGIPRAIDYYQVPATPTDAVQAQTLDRGWLIVSVTHLVKPEWEWLRRDYRPVDRIGYTLFVYRLGDDKTAR